MIDSLQLQEGDLGFEAAEVNVDDIQEVVECDDRPPDHSIDGDDEKLDEQDYEHGESREDSDTDMPDVHQETGRPMDDSIARFTKHQEPVFCITAHPVNPDICASGGADDLGYIWNSSNGDEIFQLTGHSDSLSAIEFCPGGRYLATGGVDATVQIWQTTDLENFSAWEFLLNLEASEEVTWLTWHPKQLVVLAGLSDGMIYKWLIPSGSMQVFAGHDSMTTCGIFTPDGQSFISGTVLGMLFIWNLRTGKAQHKINLNQGKHAFKMTEGNSGINSIAINSAGTIGVVGGISNGGVRIINLRIGSVIAAFDDHQSEATIEVGIFEPRGLGVPLLISAGTDGLACIYDASSFKLRNSVRHQEAITTFIIQKSKGTLTTGSLDKTLITWDLKTGSQLNLYSGHQDVVHMVKLTANDNKLLSCSDDGSVLVFNA